MVDSLDDLGLEFPEVQTVDVEVGELSLKMLRLYDFPYDMVMQVTMQEPGPELMNQMIGMFKLAMVDQAQTDAIELLTYNEVASALSQWMQKSTPEYQAQKEAEAKIRELLAIVDQNRKGGKGAGTAKGKDLKGLMDAIFDNGESVIIGGPYEIEAPEKKPSLWSRIFGRRTK
ncbi:MAG: hypothetical protein ACRC5T_04320 [Cetobacterium sp.]